MAKNKKRAHSGGFEPLVLKKLDALSAKVDDLRTNVVPGLNTKLQVLETKVEERTGKKATVVSVIGALVAVAAALATAALK